MSIFFMIKLQQPKFWQKRGIISYLLFPFSLIYVIAITTRRFFYNLLIDKKLSAPVIVVGNVTVGGAGKTPLVIYLVELLKKEGFRPGVVSRGYGRKSEGLVVATVGSSVQDVGDEVLLIARRARCPVVVDVDRVTAAWKLIDDYKCNVVISDDGLQHYRLLRDLEIVVFDSKAKFGNSFCLPAGPLREPLSRLKQVDFVVENFNMRPANEPSSGRYNMILKAITFRNLVDPILTRAVDDFRGYKAHALAGIGDPGKFFESLRSLGLDIIEHPFPDHYQYEASDLQFGDENVIMTEKDAVKCDTIAGSNFWYVEVSAELNSDFACDILCKLNQFGV